MLHLRIGPFDFCASRLGARLRIYQDGYMAVMVCLWDPNPQPLLWVHWRRGPLNYWRLEWGRALRLR